MPNQLGVKVHVSVIGPLQQLTAAANEAGFDLRIASGFRGFERQRLIWNRKCLGQVPVLDASGNEIDIDRLSLWDKIQTILHWSALPGASRHHWGTECDIYDAAVITDEYQLRLHPDEYKPDGIFGAMMQWLHSYLQQTDSPDFFRPYWHGNNEVMPEPWHISYQPVASVYEKQYSIQLLHQYLQNLTESNQLAGQAVILEKLHEIYRRYIQLTK